MRPQNPLSLILILWLLVAPAGAEEAPAITVASTTSTEASGLFDYLLPQFTRTTGIGVHVVAQGTGQALETARRGDADVVLVHDPVAEAEFVRQGHGIMRREVMYNDFVLIGPAADPAGVAGRKEIAAALAAIAAARVPFVSRGDDSGTHRAERRFWDQVGVTPARDWYRETGSGMGQTLNIAAAMGAYVLADRGSWLNFRNRQDLTILFQGDPRLFNPYGVMLVNPARHPHVNHRAGRIFIDWLVSATGQAAIASYRINGEPLFFPNAGAANP